MARRVYLDTCPADGPVPPAGRLRPVVEVFVPGSEIARHTFDGACRECRRSCGDFLLTVARRRWRGERQAWLQAHDVPRIDQCRLWPYRAPSWRDRPAETQPRKDTA